MPSSGTVGGGQSFSLLAYVLGAQVGIVVPINSIVCLIRHGVFPIGGMDRRPPLDTLYMHATATTVNTALAVLGELTIDTSFPDCRHM